MIEIFKSSQGQSGAPERIVGTELPLSQPADVFFGSASPGIAFYEKVGPDLNITLLDGTDVVIKNFFVIGPDGSYSRLLVGAERAEEITGLVAPEPIAFTTDTLPEPEEGRPEAQPAPETVIAEGDTDLDVAPMDVVEIDWSEEDGFSVSEGESESFAGQATSGSDSGFMGMSTDKLVVGGAALAAGSMAFGAWSDSDGSAAAVQAAQAAAARDARESEDEPDTTETSEPEDSAESGSAGPATPDFPWLDGSPTEAADAGENAPQVEDGASEEPASSDYLAELLGGMAMGETEEDAEFDLMFSEPGAASAPVPDINLDLAGLFGGGMGAPVSTEMDDPMAILNGLDILGSGGVE